MSAWSLRGRWVFPVTGPPLPDGIVTIDEDRIFAVEPAGTRSVDHDLGNVAILPGFVNAHTHLDLRGPRLSVALASDFPDWLRRVIKYRLGNSAGGSQLVKRAIGIGMRESVRAGVTLLADISGDGTSWEVLADSPLRSVVFREMLGLPEERAATATEGLDWWLREFPDSTICRPGVSPHAPYSVRSSLFSFAVSRNIPVATHLAETAEELALLSDRTGPFVDFLKELDVWDPNGLVESITQVLQMTRGTTPTLYAHCNFLPADTPVPDNGTVVYCPRTHAAFGHPPHPFRDFLARGVRVALGTDSLASNPDLDILAEARFLHQLYPDFPGYYLLWLITQSGAEALGWSDETGSLTPGKSADLVVLPLPELDFSDPHRLFLESSLGVRAVLFRGRWVHDAEGRFAAPFFA